MCGGKLRSDNTYGVCTRNPECRSKYHHRRNGTEFIKCRVCGGPISARRNKLSVGVCTRNPECVSIHYRERYRYSERRDALIKKQDGLCPCGNPLGEKVVLDHDHRCCPGQVRESCGNCDRAIMHPECNLAFGMIKESPERLRNLAAWADSLQANTELVAA